MTASRRKPATEDEGGTHVAGGREAVEPPRGVPTESKLFASIGAFYLLIGIIYAVTAYEWAGVVLLLLGAAFAFTIAGFMAWNVRGVQYQAEDSEWGPVDGPPSHEGLYLPHTSIWPVGIAIGAALGSGGCRHRMVGVVAGCRPAGALGDRLRRPEPRPRLTLPTDAELVTQGTGIRRLA